MSTLYKSLFEANIGKVVENEPLAKHTTIKIGGPAEIFFEPSNVGNLAKALVIINRYEAKWRVIGRGSNLLVADKGLRGVVIKLGTGLEGFKLDGEIVTVGGGYSIIRLATIISKKGLSGLEFSSGIPGSIGGAVYMNAGAHKSDISNILLKALVLFEDGTIDWLTNDEMEFSYRKSILQDRRPGICIEAVFKLQTGVKEDIVAVMQKNKDYRRKTQPWNHPCAGSIFRNPLPKYAGKLIEESGLKGHQIGGAKISELHGNFIVNAGSATAEDVLNLIKYIKNTILNRYGIAIETEVEIIGEN